MSELCGVWGVQFTCAAAADAPEWRRGEFCADDAPDAVPGEREGRRMKTIKRGARKATNQRRYNIISYCFHQGMVKTIHDAAIDSNFCRFIVATEFRGE